MSKTTPSTAVKSAAVRLLFFFYGSLRSGYWNNKLLGSESKLLSPAATVAGFDLFIGNGPVPCVVPNPKGATLYGELWELSPADAERVRRLEYGYTEGNFEVVTDKGDCYDAIIYHARSLATAPYVGDSATVVQSGDYADVVDKNKGRIPAPTEPAVI